MDLGKELRHRALRDIVSRRPIRTQRELVAALKSQGIPATQATLSRDIIDIAMMVRAWGAIPDAAWCKAERVYGQSVRIAYGRAVALLNEREYLARCLSKMGMDQQWLAHIPATLAALRQR